MVVPEWKRIWDEIRAEEPPIGAPGFSLDEVKVRMNDGRILSGAEAMAEYEAEEAETQEPGWDEVDAGFLDSIVELFEKTGG
jgi:hypothetical protein